jgi:hypothetical protein
MPSSYFVVGGGGSNVVFVEHDDDKVGDDLSPHENTFTIAFININYLYNMLCYAMECHVHHTMPCIAYLTLDTSY